MSDTRVDAIERSETQPEPRPTGSAFLNLAVSAQALARDAREALTALERSDPRSGDRHWAAEVRKRLRASVEAHDELMDRLGLPRSV